VLPKTRIWVTSQKNADEIALKGMRGGGLEPVSSHVTPQEIEEVMGTNGRLRAGIVPQRDNSQDTARALDLLGLAIVADKGEWVAGRAAASTCRVIDAEMFEPRCG
jgi:hypothetical protein